MASNTTPTKKPLAFLYQPTLIKSIRVGNYNICGIVSDFVAPQPTKGSDFIFRFSLSDSSVIGTIGLSILLFSPDLDAFPPIKEIGDIVFIHKLRVTEFGVESTLQGSTTEGTQIGVFKGKKDGSFIKRMYNASKKISDISSSKYSNQYIQRARNSASHILLNSGSNSYASTLSSLVIKDFVDIICRIEHIKQISKGIYHFWIWDGTKIPDIDGVNYKLEIDKGFLKVIYKDNLGNFDLESLCNTWVKLRMFQSTIVDSQIILSSHGKSSICKLADYHPIPEKLLSDAVISREENGDNLFTGSSHNPTRLFTKTLQPIKVVSTCSFPMSIFTSLKKIQMDSTAPSKFRTKGQVISYKPKSISKFVKGICSNCKKASTSSRCATCDKDIEYQYMFTLKLKDFSGTLEVIVYGHQGEKLFHQLPACNLEENNQSLDSIQRKMDKIMRKNSILECGIVSYRPYSGSPIRYQIFDTIIL